jgi:uncharacterized protein
VIYLDTSVALAQLFAEDRRPREDLWLQPLTAGRLLQYEVWNRVNVRALGATRGDAVHELLNGVSYVELAPPILARALRPFPVPARTLDALRLATLDFLHGRGQSIELASYDARLVAAARSLSLPILVL